MALNTIISEKVTAPLRWIKEGKVFYGWWIVIAASLVQAYSGGLSLYGFSTLINPVFREFGWTRATIAGAFSISRLEGGVLAPLVGFLIDRLGPRKMMFCGLTVMGIGYLIISRINSVLTFYIGFLVASTGSSFGGGVGSTVVSNWFVRRRGRALGFLMVGSGLASLVVPIMTQLIETVGWRTTVMIMGAGIWAFCLPLSLVIRHRPEQYGVLPDGDPPLPRDNGQPVIQNSGKTTQQGISPSISPILATQKRTLPEWSHPLAFLVVERPREVNFTVVQALRTKSFWLLTFALGLQQLTINSVIVHMLPFLQNVGFSPQAAGLVLTFMVQFSVTARLGFGWLGDYLDRRYLLAFSSLLQLVGILILVNIQSFWHLIAFVVVFGWGYGGPFALRPSIQGEYFGRVYFGSIQGLIHSATIVGTILGPVAVGYIFDVTGNYRTAFTPFPFVAIAAMTLILLAQRPTPPKEEIPTTFHTLTGNI